MHHIDICLDNGEILAKNQNSLGIGIKNWGFQLKRAGGESQNEKVCKNWKVKIIDRVD